MNSLSFSELVNCTGGFSSYSGDDFFISSIKFDSRNNMKDTLFVAFVTDKDNGHNYIHAASKKGAVAALISEDVISDLPLIRVHDTKKAFLDIARYYRNKFHIPFIALTGSNGKTTVKDMLHSILSLKYKVLATEKNFNNELGVPQTIFNIDDSFDVAVIEMGMNHFGEISVLSNIVKPDIAIITKIGTAHIGNLGSSRSDILRAKMEITEGLKENGTLVLCSDDDLLSPVSSDIYNVIFCGLSDDIRNILYASDISQFWNGNEYGLSFTLHYNNNSYSCSLPVLGRHNVQNALLALTAALHLDILIDDAIEALRSYSRSSMRLETTTVRGIRFIKDYYNASPDSTHAALDTLADLDTSASRIAILGDLLELGSMSSVLHKQLAEYSVGKADIVFYVGEFAEDFHSGRADARCFNTKAELNAALSDALVYGDLSFADIVLIKGSNGMKMWEQYEFLRNLLEHGSSISAQTRLLVDIDALKHNYAAIKAYVGDAVRIMPVIKADAYSTGAELLANVYNDCDFFAVADLREAEKLHAAIPNAKFLVLYQPLPYEVDWIADRSDYLVISVGDPDFVCSLNAAALKANKVLSIHIEVDSGMHRLGVLLDDCDVFANVISLCSNLSVDGIFTHYSCADLYAPDDLQYTALQTIKFKKAIAIFESVLGDIPLKHACAGAAIFNPNTELFNMVRPGYILHGYYPCNEIINKIHLKPALRFVSHVAQIKIISADHNASISYGRTFVTKNNTRLAEIPVGYSDGIMRNLSNSGAFVISGQLAPIVGNITMDYTIVDVTNIEPPVRVGDEVSIFDNINMTIEHMAELCGTIGYEIITSIKNKADRVEVF